MIAENAFQCKDTCHPDENREPKGIEGEQIFVSVAMSVVDLPGCFMPREYKKMEVEQFDQINLLGRLRLKSDTELSLKAAFTSSKSPQ